MTFRPKKIAIVGGGIAGLAAAFRAQSIFPSARVVLFESSDRLGGVLQTELTDGYLIEQSADMFTTDPSAAIDLCHKLGKTDQLIETTPTPNRAYVATKEGIHPIPAGLSLLLPTNIESILRSPLLDAAAKKRFLNERDVEPLNVVGDESLESFVVRRFGQAAFDHLFQPLVSGIYTANPKKLSMRATMSRFVELEQTHGSLIRAAEFVQAQQQQESESASGARYALFRAPKQGMGQLVEWIEEAIVQVEIKTATEVCSLNRSGQGWTLVSRESSGTLTELEVDGIVVAGSAARSSKLIESFDQPLAEKLAGINGASSAIVVLGFDRSQLAGQRSFDGYGIVVPALLNRNVIATSFASHKFSGRVPAGKVLTRTFIGGALQPELVELDEEQLIKIATLELKKTVGYDGIPELSRVFRWRNCMPQYQLGHLERIAEINALANQHSGLELAGNSYEGVGVPACIQSGSDAVDRLMKKFGV